MEQKIDKTKDQNPLLVFCFESVAVYDKVTFLSYLFEGLKVTYWHEGIGEVKDNLDAMYAILFKEVLKRRENKINQKQK